MDWQKIILELRATGLKQVDITEQTGISKATLSELRHGKTQEPSWSIGAKLLQLHKSRWKKYINRQKRIAASLGNAGESPR
jgi:transcriptional regulator with XRE-family HTH domain